MVVPFRDIASRTVAEFLEATEGELADEDPSQRLAAR